MLSNNIIRNFLYSIIVIFFILTIVVISTTALSNNETNGGIFGSFDSTGAAIILIGVPWLALKYLKYLPHMQ